MILTCPSCSASYNVPKDAIGSAGRTVRCKKCKHEWFQEGEKQALEDLINLIQSTDIDIDEIGFDDTQKKTKETKSLKPRLSVRELVDNFSHKIRTSKLKIYLFSGGNRGYLSHFAGFMVALATFMCILWGMEANRWTIVSVFPSLTPFYEAAGFPVEKYAHINPEDVLVIDRLVLKTDEDKRNMTGSLINLSSKNIRVPPFKLTYLNKAGETLQESVEILPLSVIAKEKSYEFNISIPSSAPQIFDSVKISFTDDPKH